jgi:hypothetical protein
MERRALVVRKSPRTPLLLKGGDGRLHSDRGIHEYEKAGRSRTRLTPSFWWAVPTLHCFCHRICVHLRESASYSVSGTWECTECRLRGRRSGHAQIPRTPFLSKRGTDFLLWVICAGHKEIGRGTFGGPCLHRSLARRALGQEEADPFPRRGWGRP